MPCSIIRLLGIYISNKLSMIEHFEQTAAVYVIKDLFILSVQTAEFASWMYGQDFDAIIICKLLYGSRSFLDISMLSSLMVLCHLIAHV